MRLWQERARAIGKTLDRESGADTSSLHDRNFAASHRWLSDDEPFDIGEVVAWILNQEESGRRGKD